MLTAILLWTTLIISIILLIAVASPIRLSCVAAYRENGRDNYTAFQVSAYYLHPLILRAKYPATDDKLRIFIFGFEKKKRGVDTAGVDNSGINTNGIDTGGTNAEDTDTDSTSTNGINTNGVDPNGIDTSSINTDAIDTDSADKKKKSSLLSGLKSKINGIKQHRIYKIIRNRPLRKKLLRWFKRSFIRVIRTVSLEKLKLHARIGVRDPAALGTLYGYFVAAKSALSPHCRRVDLSMTPAFMEKCLYIDSELKIKTTPSIILWHLITMAATFPYWKVRRTVRR